ncbi:hypothetical protein TIFTF001_032677 [Ficus carica]|uniref:RNase H type-1 domain-containing protein n=1 Tax=Ficus carica TaxID=3494 RepID=A0AA88J882_FICCA|nr:hypothetical protein TIFTF001_032677 [Ficus carica]
MLGESLATMKWLGGLLRFLVPLKTPWKPPDLGQVKINVDAYAHILRSFIGIGLVARNANGVVLGAMARRMASCFSPFLSECMSIREGVWHALSKGYSNWIIKTDALNVVHAIKNPELRSLEANVIQDICDTFELSGGGSVCYGSRCENLVAHFLVSFAFSSTHYHGMMLCPPFWVAL